MSSVRLAPIGGRGDAIDIKLHTRGLLTNCTLHESTRTQARRLPPYREPTAVPLER